MRERYTPLGYIVNHRGAACGNRASLARVFADARLGPGPDDLPVVLLRTTCIQAGVLVALLLGFPGGPGAARAQLELSDQEARAAIEAEGESVEGFHSTASVRLCDRLADSAFLCQVQWFEYLDSYEDGGEGWNGLRWAFVTREPPGPCGPPLACPASVVLVSWSDPPGPPRASLVDDLEVGGLRRGVWDRRRPLSVSVLSRIGGRARVTVRPYEGDGAEPLLTRTYRLMAGRVRRIALPVAAATRRLDRAWLSIAVDVAAPYGPGIAHWYRRATVQSASGRGS